LATAARKTPAKPAAPAADHPTPHEASKVRLLRTLSTCTLLLTIFASLFVLWTIRDLAVPLIIAVFLLILVDAMSRRMATRFPWAPEWARLSAAFVLLIGILTIAVLISVRAAPGFGKELGGIDQKMVALATDLTTRLGLKPFAVESMIDDYDFKPWIAKVLQAVRHLATDLIFVIVYLGFLLASRSTFANKLNTLFPKGETQAHAERVFQRVRRGTEDYISIQTFKAAVMAALSYGLMAALGLHHAAFLAFLIFLGAYIPLLGAAGAVIIPVLLAFAQFDLSWRPIVMFGVLQTVVLVLDNVILPRMQADKLDVDAVVVLLSLAFWSLIFGVAGALLSTPLTVVVIALSAEFRSMRWLAILLSKRGDPTAQLAETDAEPA
jgi:predicted PurR-regulated permease PerM